MENSNRRFENIFQSATAPLRAVCEIRDEMNGAVVYFQNVADQYDKRLSILDDKIEKITKNLLYNGKTTATVELRVEEIFEAMRSLNVKVNNQTKVMQLGDSFTVEMLNSMRIVLNETSVTATQTREMLRNSINSDRDCSIIKKRPPPPRSVKLKKNNKPRHCWFNKTQAMQAWLRCLK